MTETIVDWLFRQIDLDEALAREATRDPLHPNHKTPEGAHWTWVEGEHWEPVKPDVTDPDFYASGLCSTERFPSEPIRGRHGVEHSMPTHYLYAEVDSSAVGAAAHIINWDPARVILACRAKRLVVRECLVELENREGGLQGNIGTACWYVLTGMALEYYERPGFQTDWDTGE